MPPLVVDAAFAKSLVRRFEHDPRMSDGRLEAMLIEGARVNELAGGGQMSPDQARELLSGFAQSIGTPPDITMSLGQWYDSVGNEVAAEMPQAEPEKRSCRDASAATAGLMQSAPQQAAPIRSGPAACCVTCPAGTVGTGPRSRPAPNLRDRTRDARAARFR
jgi:hypothetical protein